MTVLAQAVIVESHPSWVKMLLVSFVVGIVYCLVWVVFDSLCRWLEERSER